MSTGSHAPLPSCQFSFRSTEQKAASGTWGKVFWGEGKELERDVDSVSPCASFPEALGMTSKAPSPGVGALPLGFGGPSMYTCLLKPADAATLSTIPNS